MRFIFLIFILLISSHLWGQDITIYHGRDQAEILYNRTIKRKGDVLYLKKGEFVTVKVLNPNQLFYEYSFKQDNTDIKDENPDLSSLLKAFSLVLGTPSAGSGLSADEYNTYKSDLEAVAGEIQAAKNIIAQSDESESRADAIAENNNGGLRAVLKKLRDRNELSDAKGHFNSPTLETDLNSLSDAIGGMDDVTKQAFHALNQQLAQKVNDLKSTFSTKNLKTEITQDFFATEGKQTKITLTVKAIGSASARAVGDQEVITIAPYFERPNWEIIPVANFVFANNIPSFFLENGIVRKRITDTVAVHAGLVLNYYLTTFGEAKEQAVGIGLGYDLAKATNAFNHFSLNAIYSNKNFIRIGVGAGFISLPKELVNGAQVDKTLPNDITDLDKVVRYSPKVSWFITFSFTGLKL